MSRGVAILQRIARGTASLIGRDSRSICQLRPVYESVLDRLSGGKGVPSQINGVKYRIDTRCRRHFPETYDPSLAALLRERVRPGAVCLNVGANVGVYALQLANWSRPNGRVIAFEPNPEARQVMARHIVLNDLNERVEIVPYAVSAEPGRSILYTAGANGMSRMGAPNPEIATPITGAPIEITSLDEYCRNRAIAPDVLVMDIEGFEIAALHGARNLIAKRRGSLLMVVEMHPAAWGSAGTTRAQAEKLFASLHLQVVPLSGQADPLTDYGQVELSFCE